MPVLDFLIRHRRKDLYNSQSYSIDANSQYRQHPWAEMLASPALLVRLRFTGRLEARDKLLMGPPPTPTHYESAIASKLVWYSLQASASEQ